MLVESICIFIFVLAEILKVDRVCPIVDLGIIPLRI
jgi:hypothetical protein